MRVDHVMNFAWKFMMPMAFTCIIAAAVWHYQAHGLAGWLWSLGILLAVYLALSRFLKADKNLSARTYRFAE
jgi:NADH-quinone oxidoreductase subunit H